MSADGLRSDKRALLGALIKVLIYFGHTNPIIGNSKKLNTLPHHLIEKGLESA
jgi:hypothetical protein